MTQTNAHGDAGNLEVASATGSPTSALAQLMRIHYSHFMSNPRFWYDKSLRDADRMIVVAASDLGLLCR